MSTLSIDSRNDALLFFSFSWTLFLSFDKVTNFPLFYGFLATRWSCRYMISLSALCTFTSMCSSSLLLLRFTPFVVVGVRTLCCCYRCHSYSSLLLSSSWFVLFVFTCVRTLSCIRCSSYSLLVLTFLLCVVVCVETRILCFHLCSYSLLSLVFVLCFVFVGVITWVITMCCR